MTTETLYTTQPLARLATPPPMVSVSIVTYNQEQYIRQTLDSVLAQKTSFPFEVVIGEDCSKDRTRRICEEYAAKYPSVIRLLDASENLGAKLNSIRCLQACQGKYIALLEGDDYWIDEKKLQKQVDALESDHRMTICFASHKNYDEPTNQFTDICEDRDNNRFSAEDFAKNAFFHTSTACFRKPKTQKWLEELSFFTIGDRPLYILLLVESGGYAFKLRDITSVFRHNFNSSFTPTKPLERSVLVGRMYSQLKEKFPQLSLYFNHHLNVSDYFVLRDAYRKKKRNEAKRLIRQIWERPTHREGWKLKLKAFMHHALLMRM